MERALLNTDSDVRIDNGLSLDAVIWLGTRFTDPEREEDAKLEFGASRIQMFERRDMTEEQINEEAGDYYDRQR